jgi:hypothetical protein
MSQLWFLFEGPKEPKAARAAEAALADAVGSVARYS